MGDGQDVERVLAEASRARHRLSLVDVMNVGLPAVYAQFGERLIYEDGRIYDARDPSALTEIPLTAADRSGLAVGLEYGWKHAGDCDCSLCSDDRSGSYEKLTSQWPAKQASG